MASYFAQTDGRWVPTDDLASRLIVAREEAVARFCMENPLLKSDEMIRQASRVGALAVAQATLDALVREGLL